jgi:hypothetical protein
MISIIFKNNAMIRILATEHSLIARLLTIKSLLKKIDGVP